MTVREVLQEEANIGEVAFFTKNWKSIDPNKYNNDDLLSKSVYEYHTVPLRWGLDNRGGHTFMEGAPFIPLSYTLRILLDKE